MGKDHEGINLKDETEISSKLKLVFNCICNQDLQISRRKHFLIIMCIRRDSYPNDRIQT